MENTELTQLTLNRLHAEAVQAHHDWVRKPGHRDCLLAQEIAVDQSVLSRVLRAKSLEDSYFPKPTRPKSVYVVEKVLDVCGRKDVETILHATGVLVIDLTTPEAGFCADCLRLHRVLTAEWAKSEKPPFFGRMFQGLVGMALNGPVEYRVQMCRDVFAGIVTHIDKVADKRSQTLLPISKPTTAIIEAACRELIAAARAIDSSACVFTKAFDDTERDSRVRSILREISNYCGYALYFLGFHANRGRLKVEGCRSLCDSAIDAAPLIHGNGIGDNLKSARVFAEVRDPPRAQKLARALRAMSHQSK